MSKKIDYAYAAGIIDGEGCISIIDGSPTNKGGQSWKISVEVSVCSEQMINRMVGILGGHCRTLSVRPCMHYVQYRWTLYGKKAYDALKKVNANLIATISESVQIAEQGQQARIAAKADMAKCEEDLKSALRNAKGVAVSAEG